MTIEQRADDSAVEHAGKSLMMRFGVPRRNVFVAFGKASDSQAFFVHDPAAETNTVWRVGFLQRFFFVHNLIIIQLDGREKISRGFSPMTRIRNKVSEQKVKSIVP